MTMPRLIGIFALGISWSAFAQEPAYAPPPPSPDQAAAQAAAQGQAAVSSFYGALAPYGTWVDVPGYGLLWQPNPGVVGADFTPYLTGGYWVDTDYGWAFQTDWDWGWAPFHYGRWFEEPGYGWLWQPGSTWAPAWVDWRQGDGYIGWRPLPPREYHGEGRYRFVPDRDFAAPDLATRVLPPAESARVVVQTQPVSRQSSYGGARWYAGPAPQQVARISAHPVQHAQISGGLPRPGQVRAAPVVQAPRPSAVAGHPVTPHAAAPAEGSGAPPPARPEAKPAQPAPPASAARPAPHAQPAPSATAPHAQPTPSAAEPHPQPAPQARPAPPPAAPPHASPPPREAPHPAPAAPAPHATSAPRPAAPNAHAAQPRSAPASKPTHSKPPEHP